MSARAGLTKLFMCSWRCITLSDYACLQSYGEAKEYTHFRRPKWAHHDQWNFPFEEVCRMCFLPITQCHSFYIRKVKRKLSSATWGGKESDFFPLKALVVQDEGTYIFSYQSCRSHERLPSWMSQWIIIVKVSFRNLLYPARPSRQKRKKKNNKHPTQFQSIPFLHAH